MGLPTPWHSLPHSSCTQHKLTTTLENNGHSDCNLLVSSCLRLALIKATNLLTCHYLNALITELHRFDQNFNFLSAAFVVQNMMGEHSWQKNTSTCDVCIWVTRYDGNIVLPSEQKPWTVLLLNSVYDFSFFLALSQFFSHLTFDIYFAFWMFIWLFFLPLMRERRICHCFYFNPLAQVYPPPTLPLSTQFSDFVLLCILFSSAVKRSVDFKSRGVKLFPGKDSSNKFSICEFTP